MKRNLKKNSLFAFSILTFSGLFSFGFNNSNSRLNDDEFQTQSEIIDLESGIGYFGATIDTNLDGFADTLYMWGYNSYGQIGNGNSGNNILIPTLIEPNGGWNGNIIDLSLGAYDSGVTIDTDLDGFADTLYTWGENSYGQVGNGTSDDEILIPTIISDQSFWNGNLLDLNFGADHSGILVDTDLDGFGDEVYMWGDNTFGQLGLEDSTESVNTPTLISASNKIIDFDLGDDNSGVILESNELYTWGKNPEDVPIYTPTITTSENPIWLDNDLLSLDFNGHDYILLSDSNDDKIADSMWVWGNNKYYQLDSVISENETILNPTLNSDFNGDDGNIIDVSLGGFHTGIIVDSDSDGNGDKVLTRGNNAEGQIGDNSLQNQYQFVEILEGNYYSKLAFSYMNSGLMADLDKDGYNDTIYTWGNNNFGQTGDEINENNLIPYVTFSLIHPTLNSIDILASNDQSALITLILDDLLDFYNEQNIPTIKIIDSNGNELTPLINEESSDFASDTYVYTLSGLNPGTEYDFNLLKIDDLNDYQINEKVIVDYLISGVSLNNTTETSATFDLDLSQNNDFNFSNFDESQRQVKINFDDDTSFETEINLNNQIVINNLEKSTSYNITSIDYNFNEDSSYYLYNIETPNLSFDTNDFDLILEEDTFIINGSSITTSSFTYNININNLTETTLNREFTNFNKEDEIYLIDENYNSYQTSYVEGSEVKIGDGEQVNTFEYKFTFKMNNLDSDKTYNFTGISFTKPLSEDDQAVIDFDNDVTVLTEKDKSNLSFLWTFISFIIILIIVIATSIINLSLKKRNFEMNDTITTISNKNSVLNEDNVELNITV